MRVRTQSLFALAMIVGFFEGPTLARADAMTDVRDIRAGKFPLRHEWIGWDDSGHAHVRLLICSDGGTTSCRVKLVDQAAEAPPKATTLLDVVEVYCGPGSDCRAFDRGTVSRFVAAERSALAGLPKTVAPPTVSDPSSLLGTIAGERTRLAIDAIDITKNPDEGQKVMVRLVARGKGGAIEVLGTLDSSAQRLGSGKVEAAYVSPDGKSAAIVASTDVGVMCWDFQSLATVGISLPRRRASLANTIGFRAWKKNDMPAALAAFVEATGHDPTFGLAWYNRAAVESRTGDLSAAGGSFKKAVAIDPTFRARACKDPDYAPLRGSDPGSFSCSP